MFRLFGSLVINVISLVLGFALLNGIIYGAQELYHRGDVLKCEAMEQEITRIKSEITDLESAARRYGNVSYQYYNSLVDRHNELVGRYNELAKSAYSRFWLLPIPLPSRHL